MIRQTSSSSKVLNLKDPKMLLPVFIPTCGQESGATTHCVELVEGQGTGREFHLLFPTQRRLHDETGCPIPGSIPNRYPTTISQFKE